MLFSETLIPEPFPAPGAITVMDKVKVLFLAANPAGTQPLKLDEEIRQITAKVRASEHRDSLELLPLGAAAPTTCSRPCSRSSPTSSTSADTAALPSSSSSSTTRATRSP